MLFSSAVRCSGNVLLLQGKKYCYSKISAIAVDGMQQALDDSKEVCLPAVCKAHSARMEGREKDKLHFGATDAF